MIVANVSEQKDPSLMVINPIIKTVKQSNQTAKVGIIGIETAITSLTLYPYQDIAVRPETVLK